MKILCHLHAHYFNCVACESSSLLEIRVIPKAPLSNLKAEVRLLEWLAELFARGGGGVEEMIMSCCQVTGNMCDRYSQKQEVASHLFSLEDLQSEPASI